jgi:hypothetical protein
MRPHFLVIGGQKCGTSWLQDNLVQHPQIWLPPTKEVHYFDRGNVGLHLRLFGTSKRMRKARAYAAAQFQAWLSGEAHELGWSLYYWLGPRNDDWYRGLFPDRPGKVAGEICPGYAKLPEPAVARVKQFMPDARLIYLLRNPMERSWSYAAQYFTSPRSKGHYGKLSNVPPTVLKAFLQEDAHGHSDYLRALEAWQPHFGPRMLIGFFDELETKPEVLYLRVVRFLGVDDSSTLFPSGLGENHHRSRDSRVLDEYRSYLADLHLPNLIALDQRLQTKETRRWLEEAKSAQSG